MSEVTIKNRKLNKYWLNKLHKHQPISFFGYQRTDRSEMEERAQIETAFSGRLSAAVLELAKHKNFNIYKLSLCALGILMGKNMAKADLLITTTAIDPDGLTTFNTALTFTEISFDADKSVRALLKNIHLEIEQNLANQQYDYYGFAGDHLQTAALAEVAFSIGFGYDQVNSLESELKTTEILFWLSRDEDDLSLTISYHPARYDETAIRLLSDQYFLILSRICKDPDQLIRHIQPLTTLDKELINNYFNQTQNIFPELSVIRQFEQMAKQQPNAIAVQSGSSILTYREIDEKGDQIAYYLTQECQVKKGDRVALMVNRSERIITGIVGILKAGGVYIPIDLSSPEERIAFFLKDSTCKVLLTERALLEQRMHLPHVKHQLAIDDLRTEVQQKVRINLKPKDLAYIIYTSGTTGRPKGSMIYHISLANHVNWFRNQFALTEQDSTILINSYSFDGCYSYIWAVLSSGGTLHVPNDQFFDPEKTLRYIKEKAITFLKIVPSTFGVLVNSSAFEADPTACQSIRIIKQGGEMINVNNLRKYLKLYPDVLLGNHYGATECTIGSVAHWIDRNSIAAFARQPVVGAPFDNQEILVLNQANELLPIGVAGEICIGGVGVGKGYYNRKALTAKKFIDHPFKTGKKLYKTGDQGRWLPNGTIEFYGRMDNQVKIRGYRIELDEISETLKLHKQIQDAVVLVYDEAGQDQLAAYLILNTPLEITVVREFLKQKLPEYMIPSAYLVIDTIPLTPNGKIDKRALPDPKVQHLERAGEIVGPTNEAERKLLAIWQDLLGKQTLGIHDNFFELGGHSLRATQLVALIHKAFDVKIPLREVFFKPTIAQLASVIQSGDTKTFIDIVPVAEQTYYALSHAQKRLWVLSKLYPDSTAYNISRVIKLEGVMNVPAFAEALAALVERHEILRTRIVEQDGNPWQRILTPEMFNFKLALDDLRQDPDQINKTNALIETAANTIFALDQGPLFKARLILLNEKEQVFLFTLHHIISDGWSNQVFARDILSLYKSFTEGKAPELTPLPIQYKDYAAWQNRLLAEESLGEHRNYWLNKFSGELPYLSLPTDFERPKLISFKGDRISLRLDNDVKAKLNAYARKNGMSLFMLLIAAVKSLLYRYTGQHDIIVGSPTAGRDHISLKDQIGFYVNTLAIRTAFSGDWSLGQLAEAIKTNLLEAFEYQMYPFDRLVEELDLARDTSRSPLFNVMVILQNNESEREEYLDMNNLTLGSLAEFEQEEVSSKFDLTFGFVEYEAGLMIGVEYRSDLFLKGTMERMIAHLASIIRQLPEAPSCKIDELRLLSAQELNTLYQFGGDRTLHRPSQQPGMVDRFSLQAEKTPDHTALIVGESSCTYRKLEERSNQLAQYLHRREIGRGDLVGICMDRSQDMIVTLLGILKTGAAYVPVDPNYPTERIQYILKDAKAKVVISHRANRALLRPAMPGTVIWLDEEWPSIEQTSTLPLDITNQPEDLAYVVYTSGSTGQPKGVMITHQNTQAFLHWCQEEFQASPFEVVYGVTSICFDLSIFEIFYTLSSGKSLRLLPDGLHIGQYLSVDEAVLINTVPSVIKTLLEEKVDLSQVTVINMAGEPIPTATKDQLDLERIEVRNLYGPSEDTTYSTVFRLTKSMPVLIGKPITGTQVYILDHQLELVPLGVVGELCLSGAGVSPGYLYRPELTAEKFKTHAFPASKGFKLYRTGDLAKWTPDGNLMFLGRKDDQVKIRGYRIELGEIETVLHQSGLVAQGIVIAKQDEADHQHLIAYVVPSDVFDREALITVLKAKLPQYMIPTHWVELDELPLTPNGKIDKKALPDPSDADRQKSIYIAPRNVVEGTLAGIWEELLDLREPGIHDNFFALGGHSLLAIRMINKIAQHFNVTISLLSFFEHPSIGELAKYIQSGRGLFFSPIPDAPEDTSYPLSPPQNRLFILQYFAKNSTFYNIPIKIQLPTPGENEAIKAAIAFLIERHEILRTSFEFKATEPVQVVHEHVPLEIETLQGLEVNEAMRSFVRPFALDQPPLFRIAHLVDEAEEHWLLVDIHHILTDGISQEILAAEMATLLAGGLLPEAGIQYKDYIHWLGREAQQKMLRQQEAYWLNAFAHPAPLLALPTDFPRPELQSFEGAHAYFSLTKTEIECLSDLTKANHTTRYVTLLAIWSVLLSKLANQEDITVGSPVAGRRHPDLAKVVGMFVNTLPIRNFPAGDQTFSAFLAAVQRTFGEAFDHQEYPFETLVKKIWDGKIKDRNPIFDTVLALSIEDKIEDYPEGAQEEVHFAAAPAGIKFDLSLTAFDHHHQVNFRLAYSTKLFQPSSVEQLIRRFRQILRQLKPQEEVFIKDIEILSNEEKQELLFTRNGHVAAYPDHATLIQLFEQQVKRTPDQIALVFGQQQMSYQQLNASANQLGSYLRTHFAVRPGDLIGIRLDRSHQMIVAILGVLKSGGAYVPIDPAYPIERINHILEDSQCKTVIDLAFLKTYDAEKQADVPADLPGVTQPQDLAYVIYTSGSTGKPKGCMLENRGVVNLITAQIRAFGITDQERILLLSDISFDASVEQLWIGLLSGAQVIVITKEDILDPRKLEKTITDHHITHIHMVPNLLATLEPKLYPALKRVISGGDKCPPELAEKWRVYHDFYNEYGPTETTVTSIQLKYDAQTSNNNALSIGYPIANTKVYMLDEYQKLVGVGIQGEICIGGVGVARGYLNRPELTAEKFVDNPFLPGEKIYRTGDIGRWLPDGDIEFIGRKDDQVKIRGYRVELGEIEAVLQASALVSQAVVLAKADTYANKRLIAYLIPRENYEKPKLLNYLKAVLPGYMIPTLIVELKEFPLTATGKIAKRALPDPDPATLITNRYVPARNKLEKQLVHIWQHLFKLDRVGVMDNFFELGGHSLLAIQMINQISKKLHVSLSLTLFFKNTTIRELAEAITANEQEILKRILPAPDLVHYPLSSPQKRLFILQQFDEDNIVYNMPQILPIDKVYSQEEIKAAIQTLCSRHESLRTTFDIIDNEPVQIVHQEVNFRLDVFRDIRPFIAMQQFIRPFKLDKLPLFRVGYLPEEDHLNLLIDVHHIVSDGVSQNLLAEELLAILEQRELTPVNIQYKDYVHWLSGEEQRKELLAQEAYWTSVFATTPPLLELPIDYPRPPIQSFDGKQVVFSLSKDESNVVKRIALETASTTYTVLLSIWSILLAKISDQEDITVGSPVAGRRHPDLEHIIGMFVNTLPIRSYPTGNKSYIDFLLEVRDHFIHALENQSYPFEDLVEKYWDGRIKDRNPLFDTALAFISHQRDEQELFEGHAEEIKYSKKEGIVKFDLRMTAIDNGKRLDFNLAYSTRLFSQDTIQRIIGYFKQIILSLQSGYEITIADIEILAPLEQQRLLKTFNATTVHYARERTIVDLLREQTEKTPESFAVIAEQSKMTYRDLQERSDQLTHYLLQRGVEPGTLVGICLDRSADMVVSALAIMKAGGAYVPIDPQYPEDRINFIVEDAQVKFVLTVREQQTLLTTIDPAKIMLLDAEEANLPKVSKTAVVPDLRPEQVAYVIYTSGSTGKPKGTPICHRSLTNLISWHTSAYSVSARSRATHLAGVGFDASVWEIWPYLSCGAALFIPNEEVRLSAKKLLGYFVQHNISHSFLPTILVPDFVQVSTDRQLPLQYLLTGGDSLPALDISGLSYRLYNNYGPTENTVVSTYYQLQEVDRTRPPLIGKPIDNVQVYLLDKYHQLVPIGKTGEIYIGGEGLSSGYLHRAELTAEKFVDHALADGAVIRLYKTGDLAKWQSDGNLVFIGRRDAQVQIRGHRVEPGEVETVLQQIPSVNHSLVLPFGAVDGNRYLVAYLISNTAFDQAGAYSYLRSQLPEYMIPTVMIELDQFPMTPNGKIDRPALPQPDLSSLAAASYVAPRNPLEQGLVRIWTEFLSAAEIGIDHNFFELGGHSLIAVKITHQIGKQFNEKISLRTFFAHPSIRELGAVIAESHTPTPISKTSSAARSLPLSPNQHRIYILQHFEQENIVYNTPFSLSFTQKFTVTEVQRALKTVVDLHESLRMTFSMEGGEIRQFIHENVAVDLETLSGPTLEAAMAAFVKPFHLSQGPLFRFAYVPYAEKWHLLCDFHQLVMDRSSQEVFCQTFLQVLSGKVPEASGYQFRDYLNWLSPDNPQNDLSTQEAYWLAAFTNQPDPLKLPLDFPRPKTKNFAGATLRFTLSSLERQTVYQLCEQYKAIPQEILLACWNILLYKLTGQQDITVGVPVAGRSPVGSSQAIGQFANVLPLRNFPEPEKTFPDFLQEVKLRMQEGVAHQDYQYNRLVEKIWDQQIVDRNPLFDTLFEWIAVEEKDAIAYKFREEYQLALLDHTTNVDLELLAYEKHQALHLVLHYSTKLFHQASAELFVAIFRQILTNLENADHLRIGQIDSLPPTEKDKLLYDFNDTKADYPREKTLVDLIVAQVEKSPDVVAVAIGEATLTYRELHERSNQLAHYLQKKGVKEESLVAICLDRSLEMMIGLVGILKAGGAYVPIDPEYPQDRVQFMLEDTNTFFIVATEASIAGFSLGAQVAQVLLDRDWDRIAEEAVADVQAALRAEHLAYVIYTSGSTGKPKGVMNQHNGVVNRLLGLQDAHQLQSSVDTVLQKTTFCFDVSVWELFWPLTAGVRLVLARPGGHKDADYLKQTIEQEGITTMHFVPSMLEVFLMSIRKGDCSDLKRVLCSGEELKPEHVADFRKKLPHVALYNLYGPTEAAIDVTSWTVPMTEVAPKRIPIGKPVANARIYILDKNHQLVPPGISGELHIGGIQVARGYWNRPELTDAKFIEDPFEPSDGSLIYKTGDLARWLPDGHIEYLGRLDFQVKIRGFRIELGEIESTLQLHPSVVQCVVLAKEDQHDNKRLVAYVVPQELFDKEQLLDHLQARLPDYMVPALIIPLQELPLTPNGKLDRKALPEPDASALVGHDYLPPETETQKQLAELWKAVLGVARVGLRDNFFELGGHSLDAVRITNRISRVFKIKITLKDFFDHFVLQELAQFVEKSQAGVFNPILPAPTLAQYPLSPPQSGLFVLQTLTPENRSYNMPAAIPLPAGKKLSKRTIRKAIDRLVARYESLRTTYHYDEDEVFQVIHDQLTFEIEDYKGGHLEDVLKKFTRPFDLGQLPLFRVGFYTHKGERTLLIDTHHIITDGESQRILWRDMNSILEGQELAPVALQYKDYAYWLMSDDQQQNFKKQEEFWLGIYPEESPILELPTDFPRSEIRSSQGAEAVFSLSDEETQVVYQLSKKNRATVYNVLLSVWAILLSKIANQEDVSVGTPFAGRSHPDLESIVGIFASILPMRNYPVKTKTYANFLEEVKHNFTDVFDNQNYPFEWLVEKVWNGKVKDRNPIFDTVLAMFTREGNDEFKEVKNEEIQFREDTVSVKFDLYLTVIDYGDQIDCNLSYCSELFRQDTIERWVGYFRKILMALQQDQQILLADIDIRSSEEQQQLAEFNDTHVDFQPESVLRLIEKQVEAQPENTAIVFDQQALTYREIWGKATQLARHLIDTGMTKQELVGVCLDRSPDCIVAMLSILQAGGAYVPIDPDYPTERIGFILEDSQAKYVITDTANQHLLTTKQGVTVIVLDEDWPTIQNKPAEKIALKEQATDLAYIIYTSGSTGKPKGVMISQGNFQSFIHWCREEFATDDFEVVFAATSICFDLSIFEIFYTLSVGKPLRLVANALAISNYLEQDRAILLNTVPSVIQALLEEQADFSNVNLINMAGEPIPPAIRDQLDLQRIKVRNLYGPSEDTTYSTVYHLQPDQPILIGKPIANTQVYILDSHLHVLPQGIIGELCIAGAGVAAGYLHRPELTKEKFVANPFSRERNSRLYRTGDLAKWLPNGHLAFVGRKDDQVKMNGYRIELGEIEAVIRQSPFVIQCIVVARAEAHVGKRLVGYVVPTAGFDQEELRNILQTKLPKYMIPDAIVEMSEFPLTPNGKIDKKALPMPDAQHTADHFTAPRTELEAHLAEIWQELLQTDRVGVFDNFFEIGGHSLLILKLIARIQKNFSADFNFKAMLQNPTIDSLATFIRGNDAARSLLVPLNNRPNSQAKMFMIPPILGSTVIFYPLAIQLSKHDFQCYGLQYRGLDYIEDFDESIEQMARSYFAEIAQLGLAKEEPLSILGYSMGALVAFELGTLLEEAGYSCKLILLDRDVPRRMVGADRPPNHLKQTSEATEAFMNLHLGASRVVLLPEKEDRIKALLAHNVHLLSKYTTDKDIGGDILAIEASASHKAAKMKNWQAFTRGHLSHHYLNADHFGIIDRTLLPLIVAHIQAFLAVK